MTAFNRVRGPQGDHARFPGQAGLRCLAAATLFLVAAPLPAAWAASGAAVAQTPALKWGDPAPALKVSRWVKGGPIPTLQAGEIYVVEFWATWCGPCKEAIPHLTALARKYQGKVTFLGVDIREKGASEAAIDEKVDTFVRTMGARMDYPVGRDTLDGHMAKAWVEAAAAQGIPKAFVVDRAGRIAWIGSPWDLEKPLAQILEGTYDVKAAEAEVKAEAARIEALRKAGAPAAAAARAAFKAEEKALDSVKPGIEKALKDKRWAQALRQVERAKAGHPNLPALQQWLKAYQLEALAHLDPAKVQPLLEADLTPPSVDGCLQAAFTLTRLSAIDPRWSELGLKCLDQAAALDPAVAEETLGLRFRFLLGTDPAKASALFEAARTRDDSRNLEEMADAILSREDASRSWLEAAALVLGPLAEDHPEAGQALAEACFRLGKVREAVAAAEKCLKALKADKAPKRDVQPVELALRSYRAALR